MALIGANRFRNLAAHKMRVTHTTHGRSKATSVRAVAVTAGGVIGFVTKNNKIGFEINVGMAKRNDIKISSKLLSLAQPVLG